jgi:CHAT domain-containing protein
MEAAARAARRAGIVEQILEAHVSLGRLLAASGRPDRALEAFDVAARQVESVTGRFGVDIDRVRYRSRNMAPFDEALRLLVSDSTVAGGTERTAWARRRKAAALQLAVGATVPRAGRRDGSSAPSSIRDRLAPGSIVLDYHVLDPEVVVLALPDDGPPSLVRLPIDADSLERLVEAVRRPFESVAAGRLDLARMPATGAAGASLSAAVLAPVASWLDTRTVLFVSPDGPLNGVSFASLPMPPRTDDVGSDTRGDRFLIEDAEIAYLPSLEFLPDRPGSERDPTGTRVGARATLALVSGDAPGVDREIAGIERAWNGTIRRIGGERTTEAGLAAAGSPAVLHVVAHAVADDTDPRASYISLAADSRADGRLHPVEIEAQDWTGTLVVLSACESLGGPRYRGEGLLGLGRAFLVAGAPAVVATQWPIGPDAADLAEAFYRWLAAGQSPPAALRRAQLQALQAGDRSHPVHWAAFVLYLGGDHESPASR